MLWTRVLIAALFVSALPLAQAVGQSATQPVTGLMEKDKLTSIVSAEQAILKDNPQDAAALKTLGIAYHNLAALKTDDASAKAVETLTRAVDLLPDDSEALAYLGSAHTLAARDAWNVTAKVSNVNKGVALLDKAVRRDGNNVGIRMLRGNNALGLPDMFERKPVAKEDFTFIASRLEASGHGDPVLLAEVYFKLAGLDGDTTKRTAYLTKAKDAAPGSPWGQKATKELGQ
jgi:tetratricopeptide (TPR) repeat protein